MSDARNGYTIPKGTPFWDELPADKGVSTCDGYLSDDWGVAPEGILRHEGHFIRVSINGAPLWLPEDSLHVSVLGDDSDEATRWDALASQLAALEAAAKVTGDDDAPPAATDPAGQVSYLDGAAEKIRGAWNAAKNLPATAKKKVKDAAGRALDTARELARDVERGTRKLGGELHDKAVAVKDKLKTVATDVGVGVLAFGGLNLALLALGAWWLLKDEGRRETAKRAVLSL